MVHCIVFGCSCNSGKEKGLGFYRVPTVITREGEDTEELSRVRRERWISAISRDDLKWKNVLSSERVCGRHFVSGQPAQSWDKYNKDWVPTLNLGKTNHIPTDHEAVEARAMRTKERAEKRKQHLQRLEEEIAAKRRAVFESGLQVSNLNFECPTGGAVEASASCDMEQELDLDVKVCISSDDGDEFDDYEYQHKRNVSTQTKPRMANAETQTTHTTSDAETQTDEFKYMFSRSVYKPPDQDYFDTDDKVRFYTGLPSMDTLLVVMKHVAPHVKRRTLSLNRFQELVLVLMKLRLNVPLEDLAYRFIISKSTVSRIMLSWLIVMDVRLSPLISWPERERLWKTMPMYFQYAFGKKVTIVIDCFEVFVQKPSNLLARSQTFSSYKHHNTIKVLIGITPQGSISFVSESWGGRTSDKYLTENCGILNKLEPGDMVMADRGFTITDSVVLKQAELVIPAFTRGKEQLDPIDVERTREIANVRIHVERVIGLLRRKYTILEGILPTDYLVSNGHNNVPLIDRMIRVCSALVNLCPPIIPFD